MTEPVGNTVTGSDAVAEAGRPVQLRDIIARNQRDEVSYSDTGAGNLFVDMLGGYVRYATDQDRWYVFDDTHWAPDTEKSVRTLALTQGVTRRWREEATLIADEDARNRALARIASYDQLQRRTATLRVASLDPRIQVDSEDFDRHPNLLVCPNGVVDLEDGSVREGRSEDMNSRCCSVPYEPDARSELLEEYLRTFLPDDETQEFVFAVLGHALRGGNPRRQLPIVWGDTTSGKSQLFTALHRILGTYICTIGSSVFRGNLDDKPRPDLVMAMFTRIAWASEASKSWALHADQIKRLTGGEPLPYRNLYAGVVNKIPRFTPMLVTNEMPRITNADGPTRRRILVLHFDKMLSPHEEDPAKKQAFLADDRTLRALLARIVRGARSEMIDNPPTRFMLATMNAVGDVDHLDEFVTWAETEQHLVKLEAGTPASACVKASVLHAVYRYWITNHGDTIDRADQLGLKRFNETLRARGWESVMSAGTRWLGWGVSGQMAMLAL